MEQTITAKQIHADFYGAEERLYIDAIGLKQRSVSEQRKKAVRLEAIGFNRAKPVQDIRDHQTKAGMSEAMIEAIDYYRVYYPQNKFITDDEVIKLCNKYGLLLGDAGNYIGDMPEKNLNDIEAFKLRDEEKVEKRKYPTGYMDAFDRLQYFDMSSNAQPAIPTIPLQYIHWNPRRTGESIRQLAEHRRQIEAASRLYMRYPADEKEKIKAQEKVELEARPYMICAPSQDFHTRGYELRQGARLVWDPVVLQPVDRNGIKGYLIVTAWGDEASDPIVVNEISN